MSVVKEYWNRVINIGIEPSLHEKDAKYIRLTNAISVITSVWLFSTIPSLLPLYPSSKFLILNSILFPILWPFSLYLNHKRFYILAKLFYSYTALICISLNALQVGREADNHLFLLLLSIFAFYSYPPKQMKYISLVSLSSLFCFIGIEIYLTSHPPILEAPPEFFQIARLISLVALCVLVYVLTLYNYKTLNNAQDLLEIEHKKSETLLLNILPPVIAERLKVSNSVIAERTNEATILFADVVGFTVLSQTMEPEKLVALLNDLFSEFDTITKSYHLEKIKTIGDAYMVAGGIPEPRKDHCEAVALCALEMQAIMHKGISRDLQKFRVRIGIHTGPVVAGVIGKSKFIYDLWGDSVNTASRMESHGMEDKIQVSKEVYLKLKDSFEFENKREIQVKGKGLMETYFLIGKKAGVD
ncbi:MAG TPA: adenylate/guanylate cyclase domain-containing protein [Leptospiraceae bacterium]|nr:adenylate/guanylate cyclase domain-containing protein [Leptospiraceae bacterium]HMW04874.1 adenylate/guanylate cyclase domain-containing protein [Leptospiraceae bacterium]HMX32557.1 adenylate/guanylate cyclase domain-containing protein [Leptospiraceae bacterium]HMY30905.1 adenylate/guanylate cyclase domain-containing protein [Leptospiraceae bacterium]HMZ62709.1 adenylate/guanylate cyclase domain-containing protein [Leptospiraceae bacterium]